MNNYRWEEVDSERAWRRRYYRIHGSESSNNSVARRSRHLRQCADFCIRWLSPILPEFLPTVEGPCGHYTTLTCFAFEAMFVVAFHIWPFYSPVHDVMGTTGSLGSHLWLGRYAFLGYITSGLCLATWAFGYLDAEWWESRISTRVNLYIANLGVALARFIIEAILFFMLIFGQGWLIKNWHAYGDATLWVELDRKSVV